MKKLLGLLVCSSLLFSCKNDPKVAGATEVKPTSDAPVTDSRGYEFGDDKFIEIGKKSSAAMESKDIDSWSANLADNAVYQWNNFDSIVGKAAITDYWKKRATDIVDSISFTKQVWLPIKVNKPMVEGQLTGNYLLCWQITYARYKTGKSMKQRVHLVYHFNDNNKIDRLSQYLDRVPINAAMAN